MSGNGNLFAVSRISIFLVFFFTVSSLALNDNCPSSYCGNIRISNPFRLTTSRKSCGGDDPSFELECQKNNQTIFKARSTTSRYIVLDINYEVNSLRVVDPTINRSNLSSCPLHSNNGHDVWPSIFDFFFRPTIQVSFIYCTAPVNSSNYVEGPFCGNRSSIFYSTSSSSQMHSYVMVGDRILVSDVEESCTVYRSVYSSGRSEMKENSSLAAIYDYMAYGVELSWNPFLCRGCRVSEEWRKWKNATCIVEGNRTSCRVRAKESFSELPLKYKFHYIGYFVLFYGTIAIGAHVALRFLIGFPFLVGLVLRKWRRRHRAMDETIEEFLQGQNNLTPIKYTYAEIKKMTNNFNQRLGEGAYGTVYKGQLRSGPYVAVKMMEQSMATEQEFISEVGTIGRIHHVNVVQLVGFSVEGSKCALVYEYLPNGSLDRYIFSQQGLEVTALRYEKMFEIALGVARGIDYLHRGCDMQILHFDIKPHNILLNEKFEPKISDFGLAKLYPTDGGTVNLTAARGTMGYMAPEMFYKNVGGVSYKADVYSFGMLLMEMGGRRKNMNPFEVEESQIFFPSWVYEQLINGKEVEVMDATEDEKKLMMKMMIVALWCIQMKPCDRPSMNKVVEMLESESESESQLQIPPKPFVAPREIADDHEIIETTSTI